MKARESVEFFLGDECNSRLPKEASLQLNKVDVEQHPKAMLMEKDKKINILDDLQ